MLGSEPLNIMTERKDDSRNTWTFPRKIVPGQNKDNVQNKTIFKHLEGQGESEAEAEGGGNGGKSSHQGEAETQPGTKKLLLENANEQTTHAMSVG